MRRPLGQPQVVAQVVDLVVEGDQDALWVRDTLVPVVQPARTVPA